ncbi:MAG: endonuclease domain-containing protein [Patescibacteria group bacterium]
MYEARKIKATKYARKLRKKITDEERALWYKLKAGRFLGLKFKRQEPIGPYIVDFYCHSKKLIIELDGGHHNEEEVKGYDEERTLYLESKGLRVIRFWNYQINKNINLVLDQIIILGDLE